MYGKKTPGKLVGPLKELQDGLGSYQDSIVAADLLGRVVADGRSSRRGQPSRSASSPNATSGRPST